VYQRGGDKFHASCYEGESLDIFRRKCDYGWDLVLRKADGTPAAFMRIISEEK